MLLYDISYYRSPAHLKMQNMSLFILASIMLQVRACKKKQQRHLSLAYYEFQFLFSVPQCNYIMKPSSV